MIFLLVLGAIVLAVYFGYIAGVRRERGRAELLAEMEVKRNPPERRGVRLSRIRVTR